MNNIESLQLFKDLQAVSTNYSDVKLKNSIVEIENNRKLKSSLEHNYAKIDEINNKCAFLSFKTKEEIKDLNNDEIKKVIMDLNNFSSKRYNVLKKAPIECTTTKAVMFSTIDKLAIINESINNKDYKKDKSVYVSLYQQITSNAFATFLALKDMNLDETIMNTLSQAIFNQIKVISIIGM